ncbi:MAG: hypothetical protein ACYC3B_00710 [Sedimentisphaerales bacterium]
MLEKKANLKSGKVGSALIMTVVLTVLLAIVAVMFVMVARMDSASTSNIVDSKTLDNAAKSIIEIIGKELVLDTPGVALKAGLPNNRDTQKYYDYQDYPDVNDAWLANIEPYTTDGTDYYWQQISDVTGYLKQNYGESNIRNILVEPKGLTSSTVVPEYPKFDIDKDGKLLKVNGIGSTSPAPNGISADADGDGIADSKWIELAGIDSSKGKKVFAAIRVIDNCAMVNVNTAYKFDANTTVSGDRFRVDGTSQLQINLGGLLKSRTAKKDDIDKFHNARCGGSNNDTRDGWNQYDNRVIWKYDYPPMDPYLPFDISDELELRYRYCIDSKFASRIETDANMPATIRGAGLPDFGNLYNDNWGLPDWKNWIPETGRTLEDSDRRHLLTTYSFDRLIDPNGEKMFYVRSANSDENKAQLLYGKLTGAIDKDHLGNGVDETDMKYYLAQFAANIADRGDEDPDVSIVKVSGVREFYGEERPYIYISEIARNFYSPRTPEDANIYRSYAIELCREFESPDGNDIFEPWTLVITDSGMSPIVIDSNDFQDRGGQFYVIILEDANNPNAKLYDQVKFADSPPNGARGVDPTVTLRWGRMFMGYEPNATDPNNYDRVWSDTYDFYIGGSEAGVKNSTTPTVSDTTGHSYNAAPDYALGTTYYWRVDGKKIIDGNEVKINGPVWSFTTWAAEPNSVYKKGRFLFGDNTVVRLFRPMKTGADIKVDEVELPSWLTGETLFDDIKTFKRDMSWGNRLKHIWNLYDANSRGDISLGNSWDYYSGIGNPIQPWYNYFTTVGDAAMTFAKKSIYYEDGNPIGPLDTEADVHFDIDNPSMQNVFKYITAMNPANYTSNDANETRVRGRLNINTAPAFVIAQLPWVSKANRKDLKIADAIVAYRDKTKVGSSPDYSGLLGRKNITGIDDIYESPGFRSIGELLSVINKSGNKEYNIRYCGMDGQPQYGFPDLQFDTWSMDDGTTDDLEEKELIFARISDLATVRSDTFTAYILVRVGVNGPQKRFIAILDRTGVKQPTDKIKVEAFQQVPAAR